MVPDKAGVSASPLGREWTERDCCWPPVCLYSWVANALILTLAFHYAHIMQKRSAAGRLSPTDVRGESERAREREVSALLLILHVFFVVT